MLSRRQLDPRHRQGTRYACIVAAGKPDGSGRIRGTPAGAMTFSWQSRSHSGQPALTGKDELLTIGIELLLTMLGLVTRSRNRRR